MGTIRLSDDFVSPAISKPNPKVTFNNKENEKIIGEIESYWEQTTYEDSFELAPIYLKNKLHLYAIGSSGYIPGKISWEPSSFTNGGNIDYDLVVNIEDATPIGDIVIPSGYEDYYLHDSISKFYIDTTYTTYVSASELSGKVIIFDLDNWLDTQTSVSFNALFKNNKNITHLDLSNIHSKKITNLRDVFSGCTNLTFIDLSNFDTSNVTNMYAMFNNCALTSLNITNFDIRKLTTLEYTFSSNPNLVTLDLNNWNTSNINSLYQVFTSCTNLSNLNISEWDIRKVTTLQQLFEGCSSLTRLDVSKWNTSKVERMNYTFRGTGLTSLDLSTWETPQLVSLYYTFSESSSLKVLDLSNFDTRNVTSWLNPFASTDLEYLIIGSSEFKFELKEDTYLPNKCKILVPSALISTYQNATNWSAHASKFDVIENYNVVRSNGQVTVTPKNV